MVISGQRANVTCFLDTPSCLVLREELLKARSVLQDPIHEEPLDPSRLAVVSMLPSTVALALPFGAPPPAPWKRHTFQPRTAGALHRWSVRFEVAVQRGDL